MEIYGIDHFRPTYQIEFFFNDEDVDSASPDPGRGSYAGEITVFGHSRCGGDEGHCDASRQPTRFGDPRSHHLTKAFKRLNVTEAMEVAREQGDELTITAIANPLDDPDPDNPHQKLFDIAGMQLVAFD